MPTHIKRICSVIDKLPPDLDFEVSEQSEPGESGLSQGLESSHLSDQSSNGAASLLEDAGSQPSNVASRDVTLDSSVSQRIEERAFKKPKKRGRAAELQQWIASLVICLLQSVSGTLYDTIMHRSKWKHDFFLTVSFGVLLLHLVP